MIYSDTDPAGVSELVLQGRSTESLTLQWSVPAVGQWDSFLVECSPPDGIIRAPQINSVGVFYKMKYLPFDLEQFLTNHSDLGLIKV